VGRGWHKKYGGPHAEAFALKDSGSLAKEATAYVTLEPCNHYGKTPPCAKALADAGVSRVVVAMKDPNPGVTGNGLAWLQERGIECKCGVLESEALKLNDVFLANVVRGRAHVMVKVASTLDGFIAPANVRHAWITSEESRREVHRMRSEADAIIIGAGTLRTDNPLLNVRYGFNGAPRRIVLTSTLDLPMKSHLLNDDHASETIVVCPHAAMKDNPRAISKLHDKGIIVKPVRAARTGGVSFKALVAFLPSIGIYDVMVEGGAKVFSGFIQSGVVDRMEWFVAPMLLGGGVPAMGFPAPYSLSLAPRFDVEKIVTHGNDLQISMIPRR
jgi:diaminohydroxyphosphoribosylaminopyrimidine deaminase/5-amino-6-(5-phosphoribosylamino)uracil reductase